MDYLPQKDNRRGNKFAKSKKHFSKNKYSPRTKADMTEPRTRPSEDLGKVSGMGRKERKKLATETLNILDKGFYMSYDNTINEKIKVEVSHLVDHAIQQTITYLPDQTPIDLEEVKRDDGCTDFSVVLKSTLQACYDEYYCNDNSNSNCNKTRNNIGALNFASAKNPGGGFLKGSSAQEESLAVSSGLYPCIKDSSMYEINNQDNNHCLYSHALIISEDVPIFRSDQDDCSLLPEPYFVTILTVPAVNSGEAKKRGISEEIINQTMFSRMDRMLSVAVKHNIDTLILGSWGCGVFKGDLEFVAESFLDLLRNKYQGYFKKIIFAVVSEQDYQTFNKILFTKK